MFIIIYSQEEVPGLETISGHFCESVGEART
jgi:hypothetical protein